MDEPAWRGAFITIVTPSLVMNTGRARSSSVSLEKALLKTSARLFHGVSPLVSTDKSPVGETRQPELTVEREHMVLIITLDKTLPSFNRSHIGKRLEMRDFLHPFRIRFLGFYRDRIRLEVNDVPRVSGYFVRSIFFIGGR